MVINVNFFQAATIEHPRALANCIALTKDYAANFHRSPQRANEILNRIVTSFNGLNQHHKIAFLRLLLPTRKGFETRSKHALEFSIVFLICVCLALLLIQFLLDFSMNTQAIGPILILGTLLIYQSFKNSAYYYQPYLEILNTLEPIIDVNAVQEDMHPSELLKFL